MIHIAVTDARNKKNYLADAISLLILSFYAV